MTDFAEFNALAADYTTLSRAVNDTLCRETDPYLWDGDECASEIMAIFVHWLPDMVRHEEARKLREQARKYGSAIAAKALRAAADKLDPFYIDKDSAGTPSWFRKRDHKLVPWRVCKDPEPEDIRATQGS